MRVVPFEEFVERELPTLAKRSRAPLAIFVSSYNEVNGFNAHTDLKVDSGLRIIVRAQSWSLDEILGEMSSLLAGQALADMGAPEVLHDVVDQQRETIAERQRAVARRVLDAGDPQGDGKKNGRTIAFVYAGLRGIEPAAELCKEFSARGVRVFAVTCDCVDNWDLERFTANGGSTEIIMGSCGGQRVLGEIVRAAMTEWLKKKPRASARRPKRSEKK